MIVYKIVNLTNGKLYIGQTVRSLSVRKNEQWSYEISTFLEIE